MEMKGLLHSNDYKEIEVDVPYKQKNINVKKGYESDEDISPSKHVKNRVTINLQNLNNFDKTISSDSEANKYKNDNKRCTINLKETFNLLHNYSNEDDSQDSLTETKKPAARDSLISTSPIHVKSDKIFFEACLSSASRTIETAEAKSKEIHKQINNKLLEDKTNNFELKEEVIIPNKILNNEVKYNDNNQIKTEILHKKENIMGTPEIDNKRVTLAISDIFHDAVFSNHKINPLTSKLIEKSPIHKNEEKRQNLFNNTSTNNDINTNNTKIDAMHISPMKPSINLYKMSNDKTDVDKRLNWLTTYMTESGFQRMKIVEKCENDIAEMEIKLKKNQDLINLKARKENIKAKLATLENENDQYFKRKLLNEFKSNLFGFKILNSENNSLKIQLMNKINVKLHFKSYDSKLININNKDNSNNINNLIIIKSEFSLFNVFKIISNSFNKTNDSKSKGEIKHLFIINQIYDHILNLVFKTNISLTFNEFIDNLKYLIKYTSGFLYLIELINIIFNVSSSYPSLSLNTVTNTLNVIFSYFNEKGFKIFFQFEIEILNSFFGIKFKEANITNIIETYNSNNNSLADKNDITANNIKHLIDEIARLFSNKDKFKNPIFFKELLFKINENILNI